MNENDVDSSDVTVTDQPSEQQSVSLGERTGVCEPAVTHTVSQREMSV